MLKIYLGYLISLVGSAFLFFAAMMSIFSDDMALIVVYTVFALISASITFLGIRLIVRTKDAITQQELAYLKTEEILMEYAVEGRIWEDFKARKCSLNRLLIKAALYALIIGLLSYFLLIPELQSEGYTSPDRLALLFSFAGFIIVAIIEYRTSFKIYGRLNKFDKGEIKIFRNHIELNDQIIPLNAMGFSLNAVRINDKKLTRFLVFYRNHHDVRKIYVRNIWFPLIEKNIEKAKEVLLILNNKS